MSNKREDIQFLKDLQYELKTQEVDSQAEPRFWVIMDYRLEPTAQGYHDGYNIKFTDSEENENSLEETYQYIQELLNTEPYDEFSTNPTKHKPLDMDALEEFKNLDLSSYGGSFEFWEWIETYYD